MKVASVHLQTFKRFTDLRINSIPATATLVVLVGPNGCGKSSLFDGFIRWHRQSVGLSYSGDDGYYNKSHERGTVQVTLHGGNSPTKDSLYVRTAYRNDADFSTPEIGAQPSPVESPRFNRLIEDDKTVSSNYQRLLLESINSLYSQESKTKTGQAITEELVGAIRTSMQNIFDGLILNALTNPLDSDGRSGAFYFRKGVADSYHYKNLSGGEKAAFDLLLDVHLKKRFFPNAIYCIDEIEAHLHTGVQGALLKELVRIVPTDSQLWVTTHSLGVLRAAQELEAEAAGSVCLIDFDSADPDSACQLRPTTLDRVSWEKMLSIALDDLSERVAPETVVVCEGSSVGNRRKDFDATIYDRILGTHTPSVVFVSGGSSSQVEGTGNSIRGILASVLPKSKVIVLVDRDSKSPEEVQEFEANGGIVLQERHLESYLFADDVIEALVNEARKPDLLSSALQVKNVALMASVRRGNPNDDLKSAAGDIYNGLKRLLQLQRPGDNTETFMRDTLAPLVVPGTATYEKLKSATVDRFP